MEAGLYGLEKEISLRDLREKRAYLDRLSTEFARKEYQKILMMLNAKAESHPAP